LDKVVEINKDENIKNKENGKINGKTNIEENINIEDVESNKH